MMSMMQTRKGKNNKVKAELNLQYCYDHFYTGKLEWSVFKKYWIRLIRRKVDEMIFNGGKLKFTHKVGELSIIKKKMDFSGKYRNKVDWKATYNLWEVDTEAKAQKKTVHYLNQHTDNYFMRFRWAKKLCKVRNKSVFKFTPNRPFPKTYLAHIILSGNQDINIFEI